VLEAYRNPDLKIKLTFYSQNFNTIHSFNSLLKRNIREKEREREILKFLEFLICFRKYFND